ncbi:MAG: gamma-butyrobetaine hydroxylase-like domain-containing protein [bacterium]
MIPTNLEKIEPSVLKISWDDGEVTYYPLEFLRRKCPCATCSEARHAKPAPAANPFRILQSHEIISNDLDLKEAEVVGRYALNFTWSDGHGEGIYTFSFLRELAEEQPCREAKERLGEGV